MKYREEFLNSLVSETADYRSIVIPALETLLGNIVGKRVLDLGCGSGRYARFFANRGAIVTGVDRNSNQLARAAAREKVDRLGITYKLAEIADMEIPNKPYDLVALMFVILDTRSSDAISSIFKVAARALRRAGTFVIADIHPHNLGRDNPVEVFMTKGDQGYFDTAAEARSEARLEDGNTIVFDPDFHYRLDFL